MAMSQAQFYILDDDKAFARSRIAELERAILDLGPEFHTALNESNETWHDNAPFDALRDEQALMVAEMQQLKEVLAKAAITIPKLRKNTVGIGTKVTLQSANGKKRQFLLAGHWTPHAGEEREGATIVSCASPMGMSINGKKQGTTIYIGPHKDQYSVTKIEATK